MNDMNLERIKNTEIFQSNNDVSIDNLLQKAIENNVSVEAMEKLLSMRTQLKKEWAEEQYYLALSKFQSICPEIKKTKCVMNKDGRTVRFKYAPLEDIIEQIKIYLEQCGFSYDMGSEFEKGTYTSICTIHHVKGHSKIFRLPVPVEDSQYMNSIQKVGSTRTYANRYNFCNALGIMTDDEDNDGNSIEQKSEKTEKNMKNNENFKEIYQSLMSMLSTKENGKDLLTKDERINIKKEIDSIGDNIEQLNEYKTKLNQMLDDKRIPF